MASRLDSFVYRRASITEVSAEYLIGTGIADITGEAGGVGMMGYAMVQQRTAGIHLRQWARAFVVGEKSPPGNRIVFVNTDLGMIFTAVHREVMRRLAARFGNTYTDENVILSATHTHSGPGGFSHYTLYNITTGGFRHRTFDAIVSGIVAAIERADADAAPGTISYSRGDLHEASINRSLVAFQRNPEPDLERFPGAIDPEMTVLRFERNGAPVGVLSWFPTHGTSMPNTNRLISGDNKGCAAQIWENEWAGETSAAKAVGDCSFVAGFAQGNAGDMSPNLGPGTGYGPADDQFENTRAIGERQAHRARDLFECAGTNVEGPVDYRQRYADFSHIEVDSRWTGGGSTRTWPAVIGQAFMAGTRDGEGVPFVTQGQMNRHPLMKVIDAVVADPPDELVAGHAPKPVGIATGICEPAPWTPPILPLQLVRIGQIAIVAAPGEFTITSGHRVRAAVADQLSDIVDHVIFAGYANAYSGYVTTPEEYRAQRYEGASTHFGPATLPAYQQEFASLAFDLESGTHTPRDLAAPDVASHVWSIDPLGRIVDRPGLDHEFGDVIGEPDRSYERGAAVHAEFVSACPNNDTRAGSTFVEVQRLGEDGTWNTVATDDDWGTVFEWRRSGPRTSRARISWSTNAATTPGTYRIVHHADAVTVRGAEPTPLSGTTDVFEVL